MESSKTLQIKSPSTSNYAHGLLETYFDFNDSDNVHICMKLSFTYIDRTIYTIYIHIYIYVLVCLLRSLYVTHGNLEFLPSCINLRHTPPCYHYKSVNKCREAKLFALMKCLPSETRQAMFGSSAGIMFSWFRIGRHLWRFCKSVEWFGSCWLTVHLFSFFFVFPWLFLLSLWI